MAGHVLLDDPIFREVMRLHACECRIESGSLPGCSVGDVVEIDIADDEYVFSNPDGVRVASVSIASTEEEQDVSGWVSLRNPSISVTLSPTDRLLAAARSYMSGQGLWHSGSPTT